VTISKIKTAIFPVAGLGTRFLPATKSTPKEMLPLVDKPLIQYVVNEAIEAGVTQLIFITSSSKAAIEDYFDSNFELETRLKEAGKTKALDIVRDILPPYVSFVYVRQTHPLGLGHAVLCAKNVVGNEPFAVLLADDVVDAKPGCLKQMFNVFEQVNASVIAVEQVPKEDTRKYGIVSLKNERENPAQIVNIIEKPDPEKAPTQLGVIGRYILTPRIFELLEQTQKGVGGEIQLTDAIEALIQEQNVYAYTFEGIRYDCGYKEGFLKATLAYAKKDPALEKIINNFPSSSRAP